MRARIKASSSPTLRLCTPLLYKNGRESGERGRELKLTWPDIMFIIHGVWLNGVCINENKDAPLEDGLEKEASSRQISSPKAILPPIWVKRFQKCVPTLGGCSPVIDCAEKEVECPCRPGLGSFAWGAALQPQWQAGDNLHSGLLWGSLSSPCHAQRQASSMAFPKLCRVFSEHF